MGFLAEEAGTSMVAPNSVVRQVGCGPLDEHDLCSHHLPPLLLKATWAGVVCKDTAVAWVHSVTQATATSGSPGAVPCLGRPGGLLKSWYGHGAGEHLATLLLKCNPAYFRDGTSWLQFSSLWRKHIPVHALTLAMRTEPHSSKARQLRLHNLMRFQLCLARGSRRSSPVWRYRGAVSLWDFFPSN